MTDYAALLAEHATRELTIRSADTERREITGIAVPWGQRADIGGWFTEEFERGAIQDSDGALYLYRHGEPIGRITSHRDTEEGWEITALVSNTRAGDDALTLARDGVLTRHSVGFRFDQYEVDESGDVPHITHKRAQVYEVSLVPFPAYEGAVVTSVREAIPAATTQERENTMPAVTEEPEIDVRELADTVQELERRFALGQQRDDAPEIDTRSAGEVLRAIVAGDQSTIDRYNQAQERAYTGGTSADAPMQDQWVGDLTRLFDSSSGVLAEVFSTGTLPAQGMTIEYGELASNTVKVEKQANEGDDLAYGKVTLTTQTAPVETFGGYTQLTRQAIERSTMPLLNRSLEALALAAGARKKAVLRSAFGTLVAAREGIAANAGVVLLGATLAASVAGNWEDALIDAALKYDGEDASPEALIVSATVFKKLRSLTVAGERVFTVAEKNASGTLNLPGLTGNLAGLPVYLDPGQAGDKAVFVNGRAIRQYDSGLVSLQDENIINLSKDFSVYRYGAVAAEVPQLVVPVKLAAA
ncbi:HK97 family phage prohead protease [Agromyces sp. G08B096]|uniref:HK97 family phage prohead protease n=1 Tax=Agromyces sp. G08B096 TaxID=3156399 RepID=UPI0033141EA5